MPHCADRRLGRPPRNPGRAVAAAVVTLALTACAGAGPRPVAGSPATGAAPRPALELVQGEGFTSIFHSLPDGHFVAYGTSTSVVHEPVRVVDVRPLETDGTVADGAAVAFFACPRCTKRPGHWGTTLLLGAVCGATRPSSRALYPAAGVELRPGELAHFVVVVRSAGAAGTARGLHVTYEAGGRRHEVTTRLNGVRLDTEPARAHQCADPKRSMWFGGSAEAQSITRFR